MLFLGSHQTILISEVSLLVPYRVKWNGSGFPVLIEYIVQVRYPSFIIKSVESSSSLFIRLFSTASTSTATCSSSSLFTTGSTILPSSSGLFSIVTSATWTSSLCRTRIKFFISGTFLKRAGLSLSFCQLAHSRSAYFPPHLSFTRFINPLLFARSSSSSITRTIFISVVRSILFCFCFPIT